MKPARAREIEDHRCAVCGATTGFGVWDRWLCRDHLPADFFPAARQQKGAA